MSYLFSILSDNVFFSLLLRQVFLKVLIYANNTFFNCWYQYDMYAEMEILRDVISL